MVKVFVLFYMPSLGHLGVFYNYYLPRTTVDDMAVVHLIRAKLVPNNLTHSDSVPVRKTEPQNPALHILPMRPQNNSPIVFHRCYENTEFQIPIVFAQLLTSIRIGVPIFVQARPLIDNRMGHQSQRCYWLVNFNWAFCVR